VLWEADGIPVSYNEGGPLIEDAVGNIWMGGTTTLVHGKPGSFTTSTLSGLKATEGMQGVMGLAAKPDGSLWVGMAWPGPGLGLQQLVHGVWSPFVTPGLDGSTLGVQAMFLDRDNALWIGTQNQGIYRVQGHTVDTFRGTDGLSGDSVFGFHQDREGNLWVVTTKGIDMFRDRRVATFSTREGLSSEEVVSVLAARDGAVWTGGDSALDILRQSRVSSMQTGKGLPGGQVTSLFEDHAGRLWVGIDTTLSLYTNGRFRRINRSDGSRMGLVTGITEDVDGTIWVVANRPPRTLVRIQNLVVQEELSEPQIPPARAVAADPESGVWLGLTTGDLARYRHGKVEIFAFKHSPESRVNQLFVNADGTVLGATAFGLIGWKEGKQQTLTVRNGLPCDGVNTLVADNQGALWLYRIAREAMANAFRHAAARRIDVEVSFTSDELRVRIQDDGRGVSDEVIDAGRPGHFGLQGMRKRAKNIGATLTVWSRVDEGTEVAVIVPGRSAFQRPSRRQS
jgi:ligand-binding sensor domain-containing protein